MSDLAARSLAIIAAGQAPSGAYVACPTYPTYNYCWFRDGTFIADAMDLWGERASAARFYDWASRTVLARRDAVEHCVEAVARGQMRDPANLLHTRYTLDGSPGGEDWPNFQLDGFGTLLWGLWRHAASAAGRDGTGELSPDEAAAARLLVRYLAALWRFPNADCWEEFPDRLAVSTLAAIHAGLHAAAQALGPDDPEGGLAAATAYSVRQLVLRRGTRNGHLIKQLDGEDVVDASLLWACVPFGEHGLLRQDDAIMRGTVARIETDLIGGTGGVHRYRADTFYGGGEWMLLTALLGMYRADVGDAAGAHACRAYVERHAGDDGCLPEQSSAAPLAPAFVEEWVQRWGSVACPLLWSHATYLSLVVTLSESTPHT